VLTEEEIEDIIIAGIEYHGYYEQIDNTISWFEQEYTGKYDPEVLLRIAEKHCYY
jgi:hypothetical protein